MKNLMVGEVAAVVTMSSLRGIQASSTTNLQQLGCLDILVGKIESQIFNINISVSTKGVLRNPSFVQFSSGAMETVFGLSVSKVRVSLTNFFKKERWRLTPRWGPMSKQELKKATYELGIFTGTYSRA